MRWIAGILLALNLALALPARAADSAPTGEAAYRSALSAYESGDLLTAASLIGVGGAPVRTGADPAESALRGIVAAHLGLIEEALPLLDAALASLPELDSRSGLGADVYLARATCSAEKALGAVMEEKPGEADSASRQGVLDLEESVRRFEARKRTGAWTYVEARIMLAWLPHVAAPREAHDALAALAAQKRADPVWKDHPFLLLRLGDLQGVVDESGGGGIQTLEAGLAGATANYPRHPIIASFHSILASALQESAFDRAVAHKAGEIAFWTQAGFEKQTLGPHFDHVQMYAAEDEPGLEGPLGAWLDAARRVHGESAEAYRATLASVSALLYGVREAELAHERILRELISREEKAGSGKRLATAVGDLAGLLESRALRLSDRSEQVRAAALTAEAQVLRRRLATLAAQHPATPEEQLETEVRARREAKDGPGTIEALEKLVAERRRTAPGSPELWRSLDELTDAYTGRILSEPARTGQAMGLIEERLGLARADSSYSRDRPMLLMGKAALLALKEQAEAADAVLAEAMSAWRASIPPADATGAAEAPDPFEVLLPLLRLSPLLEDVKTKSFTSLLAMILDRQGTRSRREQGANEILAAYQAASPGGDKAAPESKALRYILAAEPVRSETFAKLFERLLKLTARDRREPLLAQTESTLRKAGLFGPGAEALLAAFRLDELVQQPRPDPSFLTGEAAWEDLADAYLALGDFAAARQALRKAPRSERMTIAAQIALRTRDPGDLRAAVEEAGRSSEPDEAAASLSLLIDDRQKNGLPWQTLADRVADGQKWRIADVWFAAGDHARGLALAKGARGGDLASAIVWSAKAAAQRGPKTEVARAIEALAAAASGIELADGRVWALRVLAEYLFPTDKAGAGALALRARSEAARLPSDCSSGKCADFELEQIAKLYGEWGMAAEAIAVVESLAPARRPRAFAETAAVLHRAGHAAEVAGLLARAKTAAGQLEDSGAASFAWQRIGQVQAEVGAVEDALRSARLQVQLGSGLFDRHDEELSLSSTYLVRAGAPERAEPLADAIADKYTRAVALAEIAEGWAKRGDEARAAATLARIMEIRPGLDVDDRKRLDDDLGEVARAQAASGSLAAFATLTQTEARAHDMLMTIRAFGGRVDGASIAAAAAEALPAIAFDARPARRSQQMADIAAELAKQGSPDGARDLLARIRPDDLPAGEGPRDDDPKPRVRQLVARIGTLAPQVEPAQAEFIASLVHFTYPYLSDYDEGFRASVLRQVIAIARRGEEAPSSGDLAIRSVASAMAEETLATLDPAFAAEKTRKVENAATTNFRELSAKPDSYSDLHFLALRLAGQSDPPVDPLAVARAATESHRQHVAAMFERRSVRFTQIEEEVRDHSYIYFHHLALLRDALSQGAGDPAALQAEAFAVAQYAMVDASSLELAVSRRQAGGQDLRSLERQLAEQIRAWELKGGANAPADTGESERRRTLRNQIREIYAAASGILKSQTVALAGLRGSLGAEEALLLYLPDPSSFTGSPKRAMMMVVRRDGLAIVRLENSDLLIQDEIDKLRRSIVPAPVAPGAAGFDGPRQLAAAASFDTGAAHRLYWLLLKPAEAHLTGARRLTVVTRSALGSLPLQMLISEPADPIRSYEDFPKIKWLARAYAISAVPTVSAAMHKAERGGAAPRRASFLGFGDPVLDSGGAAPPLNSLLQDLGRPDRAKLRGLPALPETAKELRLTAKALGAPADREQGDRDCRICTGSQALESRLRRLSADGSLRGYRFIAFATHGLLPGDLDGLQEPALVLTAGNAADPSDDGLLLASEAAELRLAADLVVLSACNTAVGFGSNADGLSGLVSAFLHAGARSVLVSHWTVDSIATADLIVRATEFYAASPREGYAEALRRVMLQMADGELAARWAHPYYWAPFTLVQALDGEPVTGAPVVASSGD